MKEQLTNEALTMVCDLCFKTYDYTPSEEEVEYGIHSGTMTCTDCIQG